MFLKEIDGGLGLPSTEVPAVLLPFFFLNFSQFSFCTCEIIILRTFKTTLTKPPLLSHAS